MANTTSETGSVTSSRGVGMTTSFGLNAWAVKVSAGASSPQSRAGNKTSKTAMEAAPQVDIALLAFPEMSASSLFGMYDLFWGAERDWGLVVDGKPRPNPLHARIVSVTAGPFEMLNGVRVTPEGALDGPAPHVVCVP